MPLKVAAFYCFTPLPDCADIRPALESLCVEHGIRGTILLAAEGINGTVAGEPDAIDALVESFETGPLFGERLAGIELKFSAAVAPPFRRLKVRVKREIVALGVTGIDPSSRTGSYVEPTDWNSLIEDPEVLVIDTRNRFEVAMGSFDGAIDPETRKFSQFPDFVRRALDPARHRKVAMFCTGGIRCEKASAYLLEAGFAKVLHLKGGILRYLEEIPPEESRFRGSCVVFDERGALGAGLREVGEAKTQTDGSPAGSSLR